ncbi:MAG: hypothetical protein ABI480_08800 [Chitinophagaceae bacterium]
MKNRTLIILLIISLLLSNSIYANQKDSLLNKLSATSVPAEHLSILNQLYELSYRDNYYEAEKYLLSSLGISIQSNNFREQVIIYKKLSEMYDRQNTIARAYIFILEAKKIAEEQHLREELPELNYLCGILLYKQEKFSEALDALRKSLSLTPYNNYILISKENLYHTFSLYRSGEEKQAMILLKKTEDSVIRTGNHTLLSFFYFHTQSFYRNIKFYQRALEMNNKACTLFLAENDSYNALLCMKDKAAIYTDLNNYQKATDVYEQILTELNTTQKFIGLQPVIFDSLSSFYEQRNNSGFSRYYKKKSQLLTESLATSSQSLRFKTVVDPVLNNLTRTRSTIWEKFIIAWLFVISIISAMVYQRYKKIQGTIQKEKDAVALNVQLLVEKEKKLAQEMVNRMQEQKKELAMRQASEKAVHDARVIVEKAKEETRILQAEVTTKSVLLANKNDYLQQLQEKLKSTDDNDLKRLAKEVRSNIGDTDHWAVYLKNFNLLHSNFLDRLMQKHRDLTVHEIKLVCLFITGMSTKEIAGIFSVEPESIKKARYRLKKKLNLTEEDNLNFYLRAM